MNDPELAAGHRPPTWFENISIRNRIFLLTLTMLLPLLGVLAWSLATDLRHTRDSALERVRLLADGTADDVQRLLRQSETLLDLLAERPLVKSLDPANCDPGVVEFSLLSPEYLALHVRDPNGKLICASSPQAVAQINPTTAPWFEGAVRAGRFQASGLFVTLATGRKVTVLTHPIRDAAGQQIAILVLAVDLLTLNQQLLSTTPHGAVVTVVDTTRAVLLRSSEPEHYIGTRPPAGDVDPAGGLLEGHFVAPGRDGVLRLFAFQTLPGTRWRVAASMPHAEVFAEYHAMLDRSMAIGAGIAVLALLLAWKLSAAIVRPMATLQRAAARIAAGDASARASTRGPPEIRSVAREFNRMLDIKASSEARLRGIFDSAVDAIITADADQVIVHANPAAARIFRCRIDDMIGAPMARFIPERFRDGHADKVIAFGQGDTLSRHMGASREVMALRADGEEFPIEAAISHLTVEGKVLYTVIHRDVTERRRNQEELRVGKSKLEAALSSMNDAVFISDLEGRFIELNDAFAKFHRFPDKAACRRTLAEYPELFELFLPDGKPASFQQWPVMRALRGETAINQEYTLRRKDTGETWIGSYNLAPIRAQDGSIAGSVVTARDITVFRQARADLEASNTALQRLIAAQDRVQEDERRRIARELHDELQQPLAAIRNDLAEIAGKAGDSRAAATSLLDEVDQLARQAIVSTRRIVNDLRPQMLEDLGLFAALDMLADQFTQRHGVACWVSVPEDMDDPSVLAPELATCLYRVTQEALNNVAKHAQAGEVEIRLQRLPESRIELSIRDDGRGMDAENGRKSDSYGLLGMRERVRANGGTLHVESRPGGGTLLEVKVPLTRPPERAGEHSLPIPLTPKPPDAATALQPAIEVDDTQALARLLSRSAAMAMQSTIDALEGNVAVLDPTGTIRFVNRAWQAFAEVNGHPGERAVGPGVDYLEVCRRSARSDPSAMQALQGLTAVLDGSLPAFTCDYPCHSPQEERWFRMHAAPMSNGDILVTHYNSR
jgi:PAS domain S-box-containing protein